MKVLEKEVAFRCDNSDTSQIEVIKLTFIEREINNIKKAMQICKDNDFIVNVRVDFRDFELFDDEENEVDWRVDVSQLIVYKDSFYFYAQNKWDASDQIESSEIHLSELE
jgi:hypothetical protein